MVDYSSIENTLIWIESLYSPSTDIQTLMLYSKMSVLELCGWIEVSLDDILQDYISRSIFELKNINAAHKRIEKNYGFDYNDNIFPLFSYIIGIKNLEQVITHFPPTDLANFKSQLGNYKSLRNQAAHTYTIAGVTRSFNAPSQVLRDFQKIKPGMRYLENAIKVL